MKTIFPLAFGIAFILIVVQTYLITYFTLFVLRVLKVLKKPYGGIEYSQAVPAAVILMGGLVISSSNVPGIVQAARSYGDGSQITSGILFLFMARSFVIVLFANTLFVILSYLNMRILLKGNWKEPALTVSMLVCAIAIGMMVICWFSCKEIIDGMTPKFIDFR